jgi:hypothetical protein
VLCAPITIAHDLTIHETMIFRGAFAPIVTTICATSR